MDRRRTLVWVKALAGLAPISSFNSNLYDLKTSLAVSLHPHEVAVTPVSPFFYRLVTILTPSFLQPRDGSVTAHLFGCSPGK